jgi:hypothetical protein
VEFSSKHAPVGLDPGASLRDMAGFRSQTRS